MKKYIIFALCAMMGVCGSISTALAAETGSITYGELVIGSASGESLTIGLSPKVGGRYINPGTDNATAQWFAIATAHPGGNMVYGSAQNLNNIYQKGFTTGTALDTTVMALPGTANSASEWSNAGWDL